MTVINQIKQFLLENKISFLLFIIVGGLTAAFYISLFTLLWKAFHLNYQVAVSIAYMASVIFYFLAHRNFTFKNSNTSMQQQIPRYLLMLLFNYLITLVVVHSTVEILSLPPQLGIIASIGITCMINYMISRFWVFKKSYN